MRKKIKVSELPDFDPAEYLKDENDIAAYLTAILEENDAALLAAALGDIARARGMTEIAKASGITREALYKALRPDAQPRFDTVSRVCAALGVNSAHEPRSSPSSACRRSRGGIHPAWMVESMLDLVKGETERIDSRFLEPACGSGNFLVQILRRKLAAVELKYGKSDFERRHYALHALMCIYGIELLPDNIAECRANLLDIFAEFLNLDESDDLYRAAFYVLSQNLVHGDALTMRSP
jgi:probable addiction module antidote protein